MSQDTKLIPQHEKKKRIPVWLYPPTLEAIDKAMYQANCKSRSEFLENAAQMYAGYISADSAIKFLPAALVSALQATVQLSENRISRLLSKQTDEEQLFGRIDLSSLLPGSVPESIVSSDVVYQNLRSKLEYVVGDLPNEKDEPATYELLRARTAVLEDYRALWRRFTPANPL